MKLFPYLSFNGSCEDAMSFYQSVFGGSVKLEKRYRDAPMDIPEHYRNKIMHSELSFDSNTLAACDTFPGREIKDSAAVELCVNYTNPDDAETVFNKLAEGGKISMPFEKQFWGSYLGQLTDKFGKIWMIAAAEI